MKLTNDESGNAMVEFIVAGLSLQLLAIFAFIPIANCLDSQAAADLMARQAVRALQIGSSETQIQADVAQIAQTFGLKLNDYKLALSGSCPGVLSSIATIRGEVRVATGSCQQ